MAFLKEMPLLRIRFSCPKAPVRNAMRNRFSCPKAPVRNAIMPLFLKENLRSQLSRQKAPVRKAIKPLQEAMMPP